jgi:hypothetical protein
LHFPHMLLQILMALLHSPSGGPYCLIRICNW